MSICYKSFLGLFKWTALVPSFKKVSVLSRCDGGGYVVSLLPFYSNNPSSNPAEAYSFFCKMCVWNERK